jgi:hypothetical protein
MFTGSVMFLLLLVNLDRLQTMSKLHSSQCGPLAASLSAQHASLAINLQSSQPRTQHQPLSHSSMLLLGPAARVLESLDSITHDSLVLFWSSNVHII